MTRWRDLSPKQRQAAEAAFAAATVSAAVTDAVEPADPEDEAEPAAANDPDAHWQRTNGKVGAHEIYAYATGAADRAVTARVEAALAQTPGTHEMLWQMLDRVAPYAAPRVAAAASGGIAERQGDGFVLRLRESRAKPEHVYILIVLESAEAPPVQLFVRRPDGRVLRENLPQPTAETIQVLADSQGELVHALNDPASEVRLR